MIGTTHGISLVGWLKVLHILLLLMLAWHLVLGAD